MSFKFRRGEYLSDIITGFTGVVVARTDSLTGCNQYCLQPPLDKDGKHVEAAWVDEHSLQYDSSRIAGERLSLERSNDQPPG